MFEYNYLEGNPSWM